ncbi:MAG: DUF1800 domain-containing protein [Hansschlegelia sp.]
MASSSAKRARIAFQRFGLGPKPGGYARVADDPVAAVHAELDNPKLALIDDPDLPSRKKAAALSQASFEAAEAIRQQELKARIKKHLSVEVGFLERLTIFWSNHFSMSINKDAVIRGTLGQLERDVIRPNLLGKFSNMHRGVMQHPAMLTYLDNQDSIGPNSPTGKSWGAGFNENLGRELMELHTLGTAGGYTEEDVSNMARILTGWSYVRGWESDGGYNGGTAQNRGQFIFRADWHEPGPIKLMGETYAGEGLKQGEKALLDLAHNKATAQHIAFKLVRHFIADEPTPDMVDPVADAFRSSRGDLGATTLALLALPAAWSAPLTKIRTPYELAIAQFRAMGTTYADDNVWAFSEPLRLMNNLPWERGAPDGYPDETYAWLDPDGMRIRLDTAMLAVDVFGGAVNQQPLKLARSLYGASLSDEVEQALTWVTDKRAGLTLLFMTPDFQRR